MLAPPGRDSSAAQSRCGGNESFACITYSVDRDCRRLGFQGVLRQRSSGAECVSVPALLQNCSAMLTLLAAGDGNISHSLWPEQSPMPPLPHSRTSCVVPCDGADGVSNFNSAAASVSSVSVSGNISCASATVGGSHRGGWKKIFGRLSSSKAMAATTATIAETTAVPTADIAAATDSVRVEEPADRRQEDTASCLQMLLEQIRFDTERLMALAGRATDDNTVSTPQSPQTLLLTKLQREVFYFQTRWPQVAEALGDTLTQSGRTARRLADEAAARVKVEAGARTRSIAKMANMEAELRRLRTELRRCGRRVKLPPPLSQASARESQKPKQLPLRQQQQQQQQRWHSQQPKRVHVSPTISPIPQAASAAGDVKTIGSKCGDESDDDGVAAELKLL